MSHSCETCGWRKQAEAKPDSRIAKLWCRHTTWCPGWTAYRKSLESK